MIPYADFLYFGILLYIALPTLLIRRWLGFSRAWVLLATAAMLLVQYGTITHVLPVTGPEDSLVTALYPRPVGSGMFPNDLPGAGLRHLPVDRGPGFPLDEDAHRMVLALPGGAGVDPVPLGGGSIPATGHLRRPTPGSWGSHTSRSVAWTSSSAYETV